MQHNPPKASAVNLVEKAQTQAPKFVTNKFRISHARRVKHAPTSTRALGRPPLAIARNNNYMVV